MEFERIIRNFLKNLKVVETFVNGVEEMILEKQKKIAPEELNSHNIKEILKAIELVTEKDTKWEEKIEEINQNLLDCNIEVEMDENGKKSFKIISKDDVATGLSKSLDHINSTNNQVKMIFESSLISLAVYFELLVTSLIHERLNEYPEAMNIDKKSLTISEIEELGSLEEAKNYLIEREVINLMHSGFKDWLIYFKTNMKVPLIRIENLVEDINEVFNRRNLFVHGGGLVNNIYLKKVHNDLKINVKKGDRLFVNDHYLMKTINNFRHFGIILALEVWKTLEKKSKDRPKITNNFIVDMLLETTEWKLIKDLCDFLINDNDVPESLKWQSKINYWLAMKKLGEFEKVSKEVRSADFSAFTKDFQLCQLALLDDYDNFFILLEGAYPNSITLAELEDWPVFNEIRNQEKYKVMINKENPQEENTIDQAEEEKEKDKIPEPNILERNKVEEPAL